MPIRLRLALVVAAATILVGQRLVPGSVLVRLTTRPVGFQQRVGAEQVRLLAVPVTRPDGRYVVVVGSSLSTAQAALERVRAGLLLGGVVVVVFGSLGAWLLAGAALRPVERLRAAVAAVPANQPGRALQVPGTHDELAALAQTMNGLLGRISRTLERERRLIADASHELRTPLTVLRTELELADRAGRGREELAESVHHAAAEASRIARLAEDLLFLARTDQGGPVVRPTRQLLAPLLDGAIAAATGRAAACGVQLKLQVDRALDVPIDTDRLRQAVDNLLDNALRVAPAGSTIGVRGRAARPRGAARGQRRRARLPGRVVAACLRALPPGRHRPHSPARRRGTGLGDRRGDRPWPRRPCRGRQPC